MTSQHDQDEVSPSHDLTCQPKLFLTRSNEHGNFVRPTVANDQREHTDERRADPVEVVQRRLDVNVTYVGFLDLLLANDELSIDV